MSRPAVVRRSPFSGTRTTRRSPVNRTSGAVVPRLGRGVRAREDFAAPLGSLASSFRVGTDRVYGRTRYDGRPMKARTLIKNGISTLKAAEAIDHWQKDREKIEAEDLLAFVMGGEEPEPNDRIPEKKVEKYRALIARRATGEPIPYIKGYTEFDGLELTSAPSAS